MKIYSFLKIGNGQVVQNLFPEKMIRHLLELHHFLKFGMTFYEQNLKLSKNNTFNTVFGNRIVNYSRFSFFFNREKAQFSLSLYQLFNF